MEPGRLQVDPANAIERHDPRRVPEDSPLDHEASGLDPVGETPPLEDEHGEANDDEHAEHRQRQAAAPGERDDEDREDAGSDSFPREDEDGQRMQPARRIRGESLMSPRRSPRRRASSSTSASATRGSRPGMSVPPFADGGRHGDGHEPDRTARAGRAWCPPSGCARAGRPASCARGSPGRRTSPSSVIS